jgi:hypothetical protein
MNRADRNFPRRDLRQNLEREDCWTNVRSLERTPSVSLVESGEERKQPASKRCET